MAASATVSNIVTGSSASWDSKGLQERVRYLVEGLDPTDSVRVDAISAVGKYPGYPHPSAHGVVVDKVSTDPYPGSTTKMYVNVDYAPKQIVAAGGFTVKICGGGGMRTLTIGPDGKQLTVEYVPSKFEGFGPPSPELSYPRLSVFNPTTIIVYEWQSRSQPIQLTAKYRGTLNADTWNGFPPKSVLCRTFDAQALVGFEVWQYSASFEVDLGPKKDGNPSGWYQIATFVDSNEGRQPPDVDPSGFNESKLAGNGWKAYLPYTTVPFGPLNLPQIQ